MYNFKHDGSSFKLQILNERYFTNEEKGTVTVKADVYLVVPDIVYNTILMGQWPLGFTDIPCFGPSVTMSATAVCAPGDTFDEEKGKKIAMARLEASAYERFRKTMANWVTRFNFEFVDYLNDKTAEFIVKATRTAKHDRRYINEITKK